MHHGPVTGEGAEEGVVATGFHALQGESHGIAFTATDQLGVSDNTGIITLNATIRADNVPGLGYYARRGFIDYGSDPAWALDDGRVVGRVNKRFDL